MVPFPRNLIHFLSYLASSVFILSCLPPSQVLAARTRFRSRRNIFLDYATALPLPYFEATL